MATTLHNELRLDAYDLLHEGTIALSQVEAHGMRIDVEYLDDVMAETKDEIRKVEEAVRADPIWTTWRKRFGDKTNIYHHDQLGEILWNVMKIPHPQVAEAGDEDEEFGGEEKQSTDAKALELIDLPVVKLLTRLWQLDKVHGTYLKRIKRGVIKGRFHPVFHLHTVKTYRSSSDLQNIPVRVPEIAKIIRRGFIPSFGCVILENDFKGIEVGIAAGYHHDPVMIEYIKDPTKDMHGDMAMELYLLKKKEVHKNTRYGAKNMFVFPEFYGSVACQCSPTLWHWADRANLPGPEGYTLRQWLDQEFPGGLGPTGFDDHPEQGTFVRHVMDVEHDFWHKRFPVYAQWKKDWYEQYLREGGFTTLTGFRINGSYRRNQVINYPVQGSAFHCLLWTLIQLTKRLRHYRMKSKVMSQIHDSLVGDVLVAEIKDYLEILQEIVEVDLPKHWPWINVPLTIENEICPPSFSWYEKEAFEYRDGLFTHTEKKTDLKSVFTHTTEFLAYLDNLYSHPA